VAGSRSLIIRADCGVRMGTGHLMRCLALAQVWRDKKGQVTLVTACHNDTLLRRFRDEGCEVIRLRRACPDPEDWHVTSEVLAGHSDAWLVLDGYHFDSAYQRKVKQDGHKLLAIDDMAHLEHYYADVVLNQNAHAQGLQYSCEAYTRLLAGTKYALLRREFLAWRTSQRENPDVACRVLVTLGGSDPDNLTLKVMQALEHVDVEGLNAVVVVGASNPHYETNKRAALSMKKSIRFEQDVVSMPELMAWADVAVSMGGITCWELFFMGVPSILITTGSKGMQGSVGYLAKRGVIESLSQDVSTYGMAISLQSIMLDRDRRGRMSQAGRRMVDGLGAARVGKTLIHCDRHLGSYLGLRRVERKDCRILWEWANDPITRAASFSSDPIPWETHVAWFERRLQDPKCLHFMALDEHGTPIGQVRLDLDDEREQAVINVSVDRGFRRQGYGAAIIELASSEIFSITSVQRIVAYVKLGNRQSSRAFEKAGFRATAKEKLHGFEVIPFILQRGEH
jgi:UDP-2,4-diacetamido-2,4,6-trideoxy-beta-L-altropyranose hydrolase